MGERIVFIGLGAMGLPMAINLVRKGHQVTGFDLNSDRLAALETAGGQRATALRDAVGAAAMVVTMLPATRHVEDVLTGSSGVFQMLRAGSIVIDMSTIDPEATDRLALRCQSLGIGWLDAPVGRLVSHAERGESLFMVGGSTQVLEHARPVLSAMGSDIHHCGPAGAGSRMKIVNNFLAIVSAQMTAEALVLGTKFGLEAEAIRRVTGSTTATNGQMQINFPTKSLVGDIEPGFTIDLAHKDLSLAITAAHQHRLGLPVGSAALAALGAARSGRFASKDFSALLDYACDVAGVEPPRLPGRS